MAKNEWTVKLFSVPPSGDAFGTFVGEYLTQNLTWELNNSDTGISAWELALGQTRYDNVLKGITRNQFASARTDFQLCRNQKVITAGNLRSVNLNTDRDTILMSGTDWIDYLKRRIYPWYPEHFQTDFGDAMYISNWPKRWAGVPLTTFVRDLLLAIRDPDLSRNGSVGTLPIIPPPAGNGTDIWKRIFPADSTSIFDHITSVATISDTAIGFEFDILPLSLEFKVWMPRRDPNDGVPVWWFRIPGFDETVESNVDFDWTNDGPAGTYLIGQGKKPAAATWTDIDTVKKYRRHDLIYDYGTGFTDYNTILNKLKDQNDLWPQKKLGFSILNPSFLNPSLYSGGGPRNRLGARVRITRDFAPYHKVDAYFHINGIQGMVDDGTNEVITLSLEMIYEGGSMSGGISIPD